MVENIIELVLSGIFLLFQLNIVLPLLGGKSCLLWTYVFLNCLCVCMYVFVKLIFHLENKLHIFL